MKNALKLLSVAILFAITCSACQEDEVLKNNPSTPPNVDQNEGGQNNKSGRNTPAAPERIYQYEE